MIKLAFETKDGKPLMIFGLEKANMDKLLQGKPIHIELEPFGATGVVVIMGGETSEDIAQEIEKVFKVEIPRPPKPVKPGESFVFGKTAEERKKLRPQNYNDLSPQEQWDIDKKLGILDAD